MQTKTIRTKEDGVLLVGASNNENEYVLWQKRENDNSVHFEWDDQINSGTDIVDECTIDKDGMHMVLKDQRLIHFYFNDCSSQSWKELIEGLEEIYKSAPKILDIID